ncbi:MAG TPA: hypothetical protein VNI01_10030 [Elusimicrobiota bacterium]|nr:hypothetical protein [Elusimicrobiota bacterium]
MGQTLNPALPRLAAGMAAFAALWAAGAATCDFPRLRSCAIRAHTCVYWRLPCGAIDRLTVELSAANGWVQIFLVPEGEGLCGGFGARRLCGRPRGATRCHSTLPVAIDGACLLVLKNTNLFEDVLVDGTFSAAFEPKVLAGASSESSDGVIALIARIVLCAALFLCAAACARSRRRAAGAPGTEREPVQDPAREPV